MVKFGWHRVVQRFSDNVSLTQYAGPSAVSGYAPSRGVDTPVTIQAAMFPVVTDELTELFPGIIDKGEAAMLISTVEVSEDINTGDRIVHNSKKYKILKIRDFSSIGQIKVYTLERETIE